MDLTTATGRQELGVRIQSAIMGAGFESLPDFARRLGWSRALIYQYVGGTVLVQLDRLQQVAVNTGKPLEWFLAGQPGAEAARAAELATRLAEAEARSSALNEELGAQRQAYMEAEGRTREAELALLGELCTALRKVGDAPALVETAARRRELARQLGDQSVQMHALTQMGHGWFLQGELARAEEVLSEAVAQAADLGDVARGGAARQELVRVLMQAGKTQRAAGEARALAEAQQWWPRWSGLLALAAVATQSGQPAEAVAQLAAAEDAIAAGDESPSRRALATVYLLSNRVNLAFTVGDYLSAERDNEALRTQAAQSGAADQLREAELNRAIIALRRGHSAQARGGFDRIAEWAALSGDARLGALVLVFRSELERRCGDLQAARAAAWAAVERSSGLGHVQVLAEAELALGQAYAAEAQPEEAAYHLERAGRLAAETGLQRLRLQARMARVAVETTASAAGALTDLLSSLEDCGFADLAAEAVCLVAATQPAGDALQSLAASVHRAATLGYSWGVHDALIRLGHASVHAADSEAAGSALARAEQVRTQHMGDASCPAIISAEALLRAAITTVIQE